ncbi:MAG: hypothetical protein EAZ89_17910 [Bacteroidetes bacterium]|nr:MAG: hypothetical protein EAZ89_17910 [Bacteroidota bacterium]
MYTGLLHTHRLSVILFLLLYVVKLVLLLAGRKEQLQKVTKITRIPEMVISALFLLTGIGLLVMVAQITVMLVIKIVLVLASIPIAIIGFRKSNKLLASLSVLLIVAAYGLAEANKIGVDKDPLPAAVVSEVSEPGYDILAHGKALYARNCIVCHGEKGDMQGSGAKNLIISKLSDEELNKLVLYGKNAMPAYGKVYHGDEIKAVIAYVKTLRQ